jgi:dethiobiotin synthetase
VIKLGVTGTDTGVGKTVVTCALAAAMTRRGLTVAAMKPIECGVSPDDPNRDGARIARAARATRPLSVTAPITYVDPVAPLVAAQRERRPVDLHALDAAMRDASRDHDVLLVEGAGGLLVPITERLAFDGLFARWSLDPIIVAVNRLGVINQVRLTLAAARNIGLRPRVVVLNELHVAPADSSITDNARIIAELERIPVCSLPWLPQLDDLEQAADVAERSGLVELSAPSAPKPIS